MSQWRWQFPLILLLPFLLLFSFFSVYRRVNISCELFLFLFPPSVRPFGGRRAEQTCTKKVGFLQLFFSLTASPLSRGRRGLSSSILPLRRREAGRTDGRTDGAETKSPAISLSSVSQKAKGRGEGEKTSFLFFSWSWRRPSPPALAAESRRGKGRSKESEL